MERILIHPADNVEVDLTDGQKYARRDIRAGEPVVKYGFPVGIATEAIPAGAHVHSHNLQSALTGAQEYTYAPDYAPLPSLPPATISAYVRETGEIGIRSDVWIIPTVGCVNGAAQKIARETGAVALTHPYGCSQLGEDHARTQKLLCGLIRHPNAGGVLVLGLGCENNNIPALKAVLGPYNEARVRFLNAQDVPDEVAAGVSTVRELQKQAEKDVRTAVPVSRLKVGLKCGGSDGYSGVTANPTVGRVADTLAAMGAYTVLTEIPETFGAEELLLRRCVNEEVFNKAAGLVNAWKNYYISHGEPVNENPSPGNRAGGITTLEEKSLGCVQKGGSAPLADVLDMGDALRTPGLTLLSGPGNDGAAVTNLTAAGCHIILFTTGRGTPLGAPVPTVKIASNTALAAKKPGWIDFDAQSGSPEALFDLLLATVSGKPAKNELTGNREITLFKDGVTL